MNKSVLSTIVRLLVVSLLLGMALSFLGITPESLLNSFGATVERIFRIGVSFGSWALGYIAIGAVIVVPIWLLMVILRVARRRGSSG